MLWPVIGTICHGVCRLFPLGEPALFLRCKASISGDCLMATMYYQKAWHERLKIYVWDLDSMKECYIPCNSAYLKGVYCAAAVEYALSNL